MLAAWMRKGDKMRFSQARRHARVLQTQGAERATRGTQTNIQRQLMPHRPCLHAHISNVERACGALSLLSGAVSHTCVLSSAGGARADAPFGRLSTWQHAAQRGASVREAVALQWAGNQHVWQSSMIAPAGCTHGMRTFRCTLW